MCAVAINQRLGRVGIWSTEMRFGDPGAVNEAAAELDELGFGAIWTPGGLDNAVLGPIARLLAATKRTTIATGIINMWKQPPGEVATWFKGLDAGKQARVMLGLGVSHGPFIGEAWGKPLAVAREYLDGMDKEGMPANNLCLAALGPGMLALARDRTAGTHPYLVTPEHSAVARKVLGPGKLVAPEQGVILETDPARARTLAREALTHYRNLPNYMNNWRRLGFSEDDIAKLSDRLVDGLFAWGKVDKVVERVKAHHAAGADHVCLQVITGAGMDIAPSRAAWRELAAALL